MESIKVSKADLLAVLTSNREKHKAVFLEAQESYRKLAIEELDKALAEARSGRKILRFLTLVEPQDQSKDYDRVIRMMDMSVDDHINLSEREFQQYVMDEWQWKAAFTAANIGYSKTLQDEVR